VHAAHSSMRDARRLKYPGHSCDSSIKHDALAARQSSPPHYAPVAAGGGEGGRGRGGRARLYRVCADRRIAAMIRKSQFRGVRACHSNGNDRARSGEFPTVQVTRFEEKGGGKGFYARWRYFPARGSATQFLSEFRERIVRENPNRVAERAGGRVDGCVRSAGRVQGARVRACRRVIRRPSVT